MSKIYYREAGAGVVCFGILSLLSTLDVTKKESWDKVDFWVNELLTNQPDCIVYIVGTKGLLRLTTADLLDDEGRAVPLDQIQAYVAQHKSTYFETSAKTGRSLPHSSGSNVDDVFYAIAKQFLSAKKDPPGKGGVVLRGSQEPTNRKGCC